MAPGSSFKHFLGRFAIALVLVLVATAIGVSTGNRFFEDAVAADPDHAHPGRPAGAAGEGRTRELPDHRNRHAAFVQTDQEKQAFGTADEVSGQRSDTMMVVHVDPVTQTGFVVSFPRDLWVTIPGHGESRLNSALELGGASLLIETLSTNFNVPITHFLEVDIQGFQKIVDTIGHVDIYFPTAARDSFSGLSQDAGCRQLDGDQALTYVRARHYEYLDPETNRWREDPLSDLTRIQRQQYFMRSLADAAIAGGARNPTTAVALLDNISNSLSKDQNLDWNDVKALINVFRDLDPSSIEMLTLPIVGTTRGSAAGGRAQGAGRGPDAQPVADVLGRGGCAAGCRPAGRDLGAGGERLRPCRVGHRGARRPRRARVPRGRQGRDGRPERLSPHPDPLER